MKTAMAAAALAVLCLLASLASAEAHSNHGSSDNDFEYSRGGPFLPGQGLAPLGNLRTTDHGGPYNISLLGTQIHEIQGGLAARKDYTDADIFDFLSQVECLEGLFDTWGTFGRGFTGNLDLGGPTPIGARKANLTERTLPFLQEVALNEQGHALLTRQAGSILPCPVLDFTGGFNKFMAAAFELPGTVKEKYGEDFDPFKNDVNFVLSVLSLEELGATGNKGLALLLVNPVHAAAVAGLATSATAQATVERFLLWQLRDEIVEPFGVTAQQAFAKISALRDRLDGPQFDDQGITNEDPRFIAVPDYFINLIPTDVRGLTFARTPQQNINILTLGNKEGKGVFFPDGLLSKIRKPTGFADKLSGLEPFDHAKGAHQESVAKVGKIPPAVTASGPSSVPGELQLTQALDGHLETANADYRGFKPVPRAGDVNDDGPTVAVGTHNGKLSTRAPLKGNPAGYQSPATASGR